MGEPAIHVAELRRIFKVPEREAGLRASVRSLFRRRYREVRAVDGISFEIAPGEVVGFLGPNGAGKTTTLKMLAGLLHPTAGAARVLGETPARRRSGYLRRMSLVMGNRNQLQWDIPAADSFELNRAIYQVPWPQFRRTRAELVELLDLGDLITKPVRNLSLGERMKVELAAALLHRPDVLFLDEPTLGLDITMQKRIRSFVGEYNRRNSATVLLTSHYMADVEALCQRVIVIDRGRILFDGELSTLVGRLAAYKEIEVTLAGADAELSRYGEVRSRDGDRVTLRVPKAQTPLVTARLLAEHTVLDLTVEDPPVEDVIELLLAAVSPAAGDSAAGGSAAGGPAAGGPAAGGPAAMERPSP
jgi:ABC-2 type transport system ATP-binding protein